MRGSFLALLLISACYSPTFAPGAPCSTDKDCPSSQACVSGTCGGTADDDGSGSGTIDAPPGTADRDKDGVADDKDNCPDNANPDQSNVDGDAKGDVCDLCPQISDTGTDTDADHIGDACDPDPAAKDAIWMFDALHALPTSWAATTNWTLTGGVVQVAARGDTNDQDEYAYPPFTSPVTPIDNFSMTVVAKPTALTGTAQTHYVGLEIWDANNKRGVDCGFEQDKSGSGYIYLSEVNMTGTTGNLDKSQPFGWAVNDTVRLVETRHGTAYTCTAVGATGVMATTSGTSNVVPRDGANQSVWAFGMTAQVLSFSVIGAHP